jgi:hypothetical protein
MRGHMVPSDNLSLPYVPTALYFEEADSVEYVRRDVPCVYRRVDEFLTLVYDIADRELVGFRLKGFKNFYLRRLKPLHDRDGHAFLNMVCVLERVVSDIGDEAFEADETRRDAYRQARELAQEDDVALCDLPDAA